MYPVRSPFAEREASGKFRYGYSPPASYFESQSNSPSASDAPPLKRRYSPSPSRSKHKSLRVRLNDYNDRYGGILILALASIFVVWFIFLPKKEPINKVVTKVTRGLHESRHEMSASERRHRSWPGWVGIKYVFAFGDSHIFTGFEPGGEQPHRDNPLGNPEWPGLTENYGPNYLGHMTATFNQSFIRTYNLAETGTMVFPRADTPPEAPTLERQIEDVFVERYGRNHVSAALHPATGWAQDNSLFLFAVGSDEIIDEWVDREVEETWARNLTWVDMFFAQYRSNLNRMYDYGARNFLIINLAALEEAPRVKLSGKQQPVLRFGAELVDMNSRLAFMTHMFASEHLDATVFLFDGHRVGTQIRNLPANYPETKDIRKLDNYCPAYAQRPNDKLKTDQVDCLYPLAAYYWRDGEHPTEAVHRVQARLTVHELEDLRNALPYEFY